MQLRERRAVSTFIEVFILIGIVIAGTAIVFAAVTKYEPVSQGASLGISDASIKQGSNQAIVRMVVANTGTVSLSSFTISTVGTSAGIANAQFYVTLINVATSSTITPSQASGTTGDSAITETATISPGQSVLATITIIGAIEFAIGQSYSVTVSTSPAAQATIQVAAVPA
ncbi:MAG: hypothetical protein ACLQEQ_08215 [Nitrososphaerales archaeon]